MVGICQGLWLFAQVIHADGLRHPYNLMIGLKLKHAHRCAYKTTHIHVYTHNRTH